MLPSESYGARLQAVRARSFAISGLAALDQVQQVADSLAEATASGQTLRDWQRNLPDSVFELGKARRELIFRNAVQTHYGIGRTIQQRENAASRPYLMWDAINDSRTRPAHAAMDGHIAPIDAPIWKKWSPPAGHSCRCTRIALSEAQARARGYPKADPGVEPDNGWEGDPTEGNEDLVRITQARRASCLATFTAKRRARGVWCDDGSANLLIQRAGDALGGDRPAWPADDAAMLPDLPRTMLDGLLMRGERAKENGFSSLWVSQESLTKHVAKRIALGDIESPYAYEVMTMDFIAVAQSIVVARPVNQAMRPSGKLGIVGVDWVVLLTQDGAIFTSYRIRPGFASFVERHLTMGDEIDEYAITDDYRARLAAVFGRG